ncbi:hypothetical protein [Psittacicella hinzii]|uniref:Outer membrane protein beta-barrel domain-containing protein n=1 Tax=Psittacicella hinzii TaxID=2028575 RepID=A0A3A1YEB5_9GAMM|nr:hypothetical protein [Psittacicella hinzii]RIY35488.1 hypothetical protein CKF58_06665 [Psittacicella hinzii]
MKKLLVSTLLATALLSTSSFANANQNVSLLSSLEYRLDLGYSFLTDNSDLDGAELNFAAYFPTYKGNSFEFKLGPRFNYTYAKYDYNLFNRLTFTNYRLSASALLSYTGFNSVSPYLELDLGYGRSNVEAKTLFSTRNYADTDVSAGVELGVKFPFGLYTGVRYTHLNSDYLGDTSVGTVFLGYTFNLK